MKNRLYPFLRATDKHMVHVSPVNSTHKGQWRWALMFYLICAWINRISKQSWGWWYETLSRSLWLNYIMIVRQTGKRHFTPYDAPRAICTSIFHYSDVILSTMASQITSLTIVNMTPSYIKTVFSGIRFPITNMKWPWDCLMFMMIYWYDNIFLPIRPTGPVLLLLVDNMTNQDNISLGQTLWCMIFNNIITLIPLKNTI